MNDISDGYHTFGELYLHRNALFLALVKDTGGWASRTHEDGTGDEGWFIVGTELNGKQISYHMPNELWCYVEALEIVVETAPRWDGHSPGDVVDRLLEFVKAD